MIPTDWKNLTPAERNLMLYPKSYVKWVIDIAIEAGYLTLGTVTDGDYGDVVVSAGGTVWTVEGLAVSNGQLVFGTGTGIAGIADLVYNSFTRQMTVKSGALGTMGFPYETLILSKNGDHKLGVYTTTNFAGGGTSVVLGYTQAAMTNGNYPGFEFQMAGALLAEDNLIQYHWLERNNSGTVVASNNNLLNIYGDGKVRIKTLDTSTAGPTTTGTTRMVICDDTGLLSHQAIPVGGVTTLVPIGSAPNSEGATISAQYLMLQPASASFGGVVTTLAQSFAGTKTFAAINATTITTSGDIEITDTTKGIILKSPDSNRWRVTVDNTGNLITTLI